MSEIQRYRVDCEDHGDRYSLYKAVEHRDKKGRWVKFTDHRRILADKDSEIERLKQEAKDNMIYLPLWPCFPPQIMSVFI